MEGFLTLLSDAIWATAWEGNPPPAYGVFHLSFVAIGSFVSIVAAKKLQHLNEKGNRILLFSIGLFLALSEVYKQLFYIFVISPNGYPWWIFPFQLCSIPMYLCLIAPLLKPGPVQQSIYSFMMLYNLLGGAIAFTEPSGLLHSYITLTAHSMIWHMLLVFLGFYLLFSGRGGRDIRDYRRATCTFLCLCVIAFCINVLFRDISNGSINMFFIGPSDSSLIVFKQISQAFGWYVSTAIYIPAVCLGSYIIFRLIHIITKNKAAKA